MKRIDLTALSEGSSLLLPNLASWLLGTNETVDREYATVSVSSG